MFRRVGIDPWIWPAQCGFCQAYGVHSGERLGPEACGVIMVRHADIAPIARNMDVLHVVETRDAIERQMRLDRPWMPLSLELFDDRLNGSPIDLPPGKNPIEGKRLLRPEDQQAQDTLHP